MLFRSAVEQPLLQSQLKQIDKQLEKGQKNLNWRSHSIDDFVRETTTLVRDAYDTLQELHKNMKSIEEILNRWANEPLIKRKPTKTYAPDEFEEEHKGALSARYADISQEGKNVHRLLLESTYADIDYCKGEGEMQRVFNHWSKGGPNKITSNEFDTQSYNITGPEP